jgi:hypothetical protein
MHPSHNPLLNDVNGNIQFIYPNFFEVTKKNGYFGDLEFPEKAENILAYHKSCLISHFVHIPCVINQVKENGILINKPSYSPTSSLAFSSIPYIDFGTDTLEQITEVAAKDKLDQKVFNVHTNRFYSRYICGIDNSGELKPNAIDAYTFYNFFYPMGKASAGADITDYQNFQNIVPIIEESERKLLSDSMMFTGGETTGGLNPQVTNDLHTKTFFRSSQEYLQQNTLKEMIRMSFGDMTIKMTDGTIKKSKAKENVFFVPVFYSENAPNWNQRLSIPSEVIEIYNKHVGNFGSLDVELINTVNTIAGMNGENQNLLKELLSQSDSNTLKEVMEEVKKRKEAQQKEEISKE